MLHPLLELIKVSEIEPEEKEKTRMNIKQAPAVGMSPGYGLSLPWSPVFTAPTQTCLQALTGFPAVSSPGPGLPCL